MPGVEIGFVRPFGAERRFSGAKRQEVPCVGLNALIGAQF